MAASCTSPLSVQAERDLRRSVLDSVRRELAQPVNFPEAIVLERAPGVERLQIAQELLPELERMAGPASYDRSTFPMDRDLLGQVQQVVPVTLEQSIRSAVQNNLTVQFARLSPAIGEAQVVQAQSAFDWIFFTNADLAETEPPGAPPRTLVNTQVGLRRQLPTGGVFTFQQDLNYSETRGAVTTESQDVAWTFRFDQPLLRNFGSDVNMSQIRLARNTERDNVANLKRELLRVTLETELAYWGLVRAHYDVLILQRLYERGLVTRDIVIARLDFDATPAQVADARARVERRQADVMRAQNTMRIASDNLKVLMNHPELAIGDETMLVPIDMTVDQPITYNLADVLLTALRNRPEIRQAILSIDNTSIRQIVADNARLPRLDLRLQARLAGQDPDGFGDAFQEVIDRDFVDFLVGIAFEQPIGNRGPEALLRQRRIERMQAAIAYRRTVEQVVLEIKRALRLLATNFRLIEQTRVSRYAESENLRSFLVERQLIGLTIQTLDIEFRRQESLALAEREEIAALSDYNSAVAQLYTAMGTALEHNRIILDISDADDPLTEGGLHSRRNRIVPAPHQPPFIAPRDPAPFWQRERE